jgi:hypothetical protein
LSYPRKRVRESRVVLALFVLVPLTIAVGALSPAVTAHAAAPAQPACRASQIAVTAGATLGATNYLVRTSTGVQHRSASKVVPVYFYNRGATCHLLMGGPIFRAVRNTTDVAHLSANDLAIPSSTGSTRRPVVARHQKIEALFVFMKPVGAAFTGCKPATTTGFLVGDYANPIATTHFVVRRLIDVCFDNPGVGRGVLNYGPVWPAT